MLDSDLAGLYGVETRVLNQAVKRNPERFPISFMFQLTPGEDEVLRSQIVTSSLKRAGNVSSCTLSRVFSRRVMQMMQSDANRNASDCFPTLLHGSSTGGANGAKWCKCCRLSPIIRHSAVKREIVPFIAGLCNPVQVCATSAKF